MIDDEMGPAPSRAAVLADLEVLATDFGRLFATDCECELETERAFWPSRYPEPSDPRPIGSSDGWGRFMSGAGVEVEPRWVRSVEDAKRAEVFYDRGGRPVVNSVGEPLVVAPGWADDHCVKLRGPGAVRAAEAINRSNAWVLDSCRILAPILWPCRSLVVRTFCWPDVVAAVADLAGRSSLRPCVWYVTAGGQSYSLDIWRRRADFELGGPIIPPAIAERIGDEPENIWAKRPAFLRDSETAAQWLIDRLAEPADDARFDPVADDVRFDPVAASLSAVIEGGLGSVLNMAANAKATDRASGIIRDRLAKDQTLYDWTAKDWADDLGMSNKTILKCDAWKYTIMGWRAANRVSKETRK